VLKTRPFNLLTGALISFLLLALCFPNERSKLLSAKGYVHPVMTPRVSSPFGNRNHPIYKAVRHHDGIDLAAPEGAAIRAISEGLVVFADPYAGYGNLVVIQHPEGFTSHYGHCKTIKVSPGTRVKAGEVIATVGSTGNVTGPHLHLEIRIDGKPQNPEDYIPGLTGKPKG